MIALFGKTLLPIQLRDGRLSPKMTDSILCIRDILVRSQILGSVPV
jgi:hypothetical protein